MNECEKISMDGMKFVADFYRNWSIWKSKPNSEENAVEHIFDSCAFFIGKKKRSFSKRLPLSFTEKKDEVTANLN